MGVLSKGKEQPASGAMPSGAWVEGTAVGGVMKRLLLTLVVLCGANTVAVAGDVGEGTAAFNRKDYATALAKYTKAAKAGDARAQYNLGVMYDNGQGVTQDYQQAVRWYTKAAEAGIPRAQYNLGVMYDNGQGVKQDYRQAHKWLNLAASAETDKERRARAVSNRDRVAAKMTAQQLAEAQKLAREWADPEPTPLKMINTR